MELNYAALLVAIALVCYVLYGIFYRLYLSPIASFPGPKLAALTLWYEFYYDVILDGRYTWKIAELHEQYGPIIRINPYEIHVIDPEFIDELYVGTSSKRKVEQWFWKLSMFGAPEGVLTITDHDFHRWRRNAYANYFSKQSIRNYSNVIQSSIDKLCSKLAETRNTSKPVNVLHAYSALTGDVITGYCFPKSYGLLDKPDFASDFYHLWESILGSAFVLCHFPWLFPLTRVFPNWLLGIVQPDLAVFYRWRAQWAKQIEAIKLGFKESEEKEIQSNIFSEVLNSDLPPEHKTVTGLVDDAQVLLSGGAVTTTLTLSVATYYILSTPSVFNRIMNDLKDMMPDPTEQRPLADLEQLPYLTAIINETLRIGHGVSHRLERIAPDVALHYHDWVIPPGTPVSMTSVHIHNNKEIFPEPHLFKPERWLPLETEGQRLQKYLLSFSKGTRNCLGMNLGYAELYMVLAAVFRRFGNEMRVVDTIKERDVAMSRDLFTPAMKKESKGIFVRIDDQ